MRRGSIALLIAVSLFLTGCDIVEITGPGYGGYGDNTVQFKVLYHDNPVVGAWVYVAELDVDLQTDNNGLTAEIYSGSNRRVNCTFTYGQLSFQRGFNLQVGSNLLTAGF